MNNTQLIKDLEASLNALTSLKWIRGSMFKTKKGQYIGLNEPDVNAVKTLNKKEVCSVCAIGAVRYAVTGTNSQQRRERVVDQLNHTASARQPGWDIVYLNDDARRRRSVVSAFQRTIKRLRKAS